MKDWLEYERNEIKSVQLPYYFSGLNGRGWKQELLWFNM